MRSGDKAGDRVLRGTMLVDNLIQNITKMPNLHNHSIDTDVYFDYMMLLESLTILKDDWCKDRIVHLGIFEAILKIIVNKMHNQYIVREGLKCILNILNALDDDEERKSTVMAFLDST